MIVAIDESGDPGFNVVRGAPPCLAFAMAVFADSEQASTAQAKIRAAMKTHRVSPEFRFSKCDNQRREAFFEVVASVRFEIHVDIVPKQAVTSVALRSDAAAFTEFCLSRLLTHTGHHLSSATVLFDGKRDREKRKHLEKLIARKAPTAAVSNVMFRESHREPLLQIADMYVGAAVRCWDQSADGSDRWKALINPKIATFNIFEEVRPAP